MSKKVSKKVVFITVIFLLLSLQATNISWSKEKSSAKPKRKRITNHSSLYEKPEITKEKVYRIELNTAAPGDHEFFKRLGMECVQNGDFSCKANTKQLRELERSGYEFSIIEEGIQLKKTPSDFGSNLSLGVSVSDTNGTNYDIPQPWQGPAVSEIEITDAPSCALVTTMDVQFDIIHTSVSNLVVHLTDEWLYSGYSLWDHEAGQNEIHETETGITWFQGESVNQIWMLKAWDESEMGPQFGYIDFWKITIWYEIKVEGHVTYFNLDDESYHFLGLVSVQLYDWVTKSYISNVHTTGWDGNYVIDFDYTGNYVFIKIFFDDMFMDIATIRDHDSLQLGPISKDTSPVGPCGDSINVSLSVVDKSLKAAHIWDYILMERQFVSNYTLWTRALIPCELDNDEFDNLSKYSYIGGQEKIYFTNTLEGWQDYAVLHEYAHAIHVAAYNYQVETGGEFHGHELDWVTNSKFAFWEGWAEFMSCIIPDDDTTRLEHSGGNIETNEWWKGPDANNTEGSLVEGAVASALYDMQDSHWDSTDEWNTRDDTTANLYDMFANIFNIMRYNRPSTIKEFVKKWKDKYIEDDYLSRSTVSILRNHGIKVSYIADDDFIPPPQSFSLSQNYPNPFNSKTTIDYDMPTEGMVNLAIYNVLGQKVKTCVNQNMIPGHYNYLWDGKNDNGTKVASGVYIYRLIYDNKEVSKLMLLLK